MKGWFEGVIGGTSKPLNTFVFAHKNILGGNHKDNFFGTNVSGNDPGDLNASYGSAFTSLSTANQTAATTKATYIDQFISDMYNNGVRYFITGHDHHHAHSIVKSPLSNAWVEQIISQSASNKFYTPGSPYSPNETSVDEDLWSVGYYIYTVDGPRLTVDYYNVPVNTGGSDVYVSPVLTGNWAKALTFGSSKNGQTFSIAQGQPYTVIADTTTTSALPNAAAYGDTPSDYVSTGTTLSVLSGTNGSTATTHDGRHLTKIVNTGWSPANANGTISDVATIWGLSGIESSVNDTITVQVSFPAAAGSGNILLGSRDPVTGTWYNAADIDNVGGTKTFVNGPWTAGLPVGTYGVDHTNNVAWAVVNGTTRDFAVIANPNAIKGDLNNDGVVNAADTALLTAKIAAHTTDLTYDLNGDGKVDASDARWLIQHYTH
ncbi:MAG TPA: dockerin type I domain-containing protein [Candidatus Methylacidiphilales bacterium]